MEDYFKDGRWTMLADGWSDSWPTLKQAYALDAVGRFVLWLSVGGAEGAVKYGQTDFDRF